MRVLLGRPIKTPQWDLMIAHLPCIYLTLAGLHWNNRVEGRRQKTEEALAFVELLLSAPIPHIALENPGIAAAMAKQWGEILKKGVDSRTTRD